MPRRFLIWTVPLCLIAIATAGCAGLTNGNGSVQPAVTTAPATAAVRAGSAQAFSASVTGLSSPSVTWAVNGISGGDSTVGTIDATGNYTAPATLPTPNMVTVQATSSANPSIHGNSTVTLENPVPVVSSISPTTIGLGAFTLIVTGSKFVQGAQVMFGSTALATQFLSSTELAATGTAVASQAGNVTVTVQNPDPGTITSTTSKTALVKNGGQIQTAAAAVRFLEQSTFGPTPALVNQLQQRDFTPFLSDQFAAPMSTYADPDASVMDLSPTQRTFFTNALTGPDQLRQRVALALSELWVVSGNTVPFQGMPPYLRLLMQDAFGNYRSIMKDVTLSPAMGYYLNMLNNDKPNLALGTHANENYARELLQLFTLGLEELNMDGTLKHDVSGNPIPTYTQDTVQELAKAFTGWTYPTQPGHTLQTHNPSYWIGPMEAVDSNHDMTAKPLLGGVTLPAGQTALQDLNCALDNIFNRPSLPPFISKQLIQHLVTSNPSPAYVQRVANAFIAGAFGGFGTRSRGDMEAVIAAILLDPEARRGDTPASTDSGDGHLREPILFIANLLRAFGATSDGAAPVNNASSMSEPPLRAPSVFNFFPPNFQIPGTTFLGPEFDLQTTAQTQIRINFVNSFVFGSIGGGTAVDFTPYATLAANPDQPGQLLDSLNVLLLHGTMSASARASILAAVNAVPTGSSQNLNRVKAAIYVIASSSQYQVER
jgi:uncharacterized protein (DUF1800 family)